MVTLFKMRISCKPSAPKIRRSLMMKTVQTALPCNLPSRHALQARRNHPRARSNARAYYGGRRRHVLNINLFQVMIQEMKKRTANSKVCPASRIPYQPRRASKHVSSRKPHLWHSLGVEIVTQSFRVRVSPAHVQEL